MCGIAGILDFQLRPVETVTIKRMSDALVHRGPDSSGRYIDKGIGLGHRRLAVVDITSAGNQPMCNERGDIWMVANGMIYNFQELRTELIDKGHHFKSRTDVEVILHLYEDFGGDSIPKLRGMFAFAIWDKRKEVLILARDRVGQKPLVYTMQNDKFYFASEPKAIFAAGEIDKEIDMEGLHHLFAYKSAPWPYTMYEGLKKLPPATMLTVNLKDRSIKLDKYWKPDVSAKLNISQEECSRKLLYLLEESVKLRLVSDVPFGALLSGGIDSSASVALMSRILKRPVDTFSVGYNSAGEKDPEFHYSRFVAKEFGARHHEIILDKNVIDSLPKMLQHYDEPYSIPEALANFELCRHIKKNVTVALSGDGADEIFGGYPGYLRWRFIHFLSRIINLLPFHYNKYLLSNELRTNRFMEIIQTLLVSPEKKRAVRKKMFGQGILNNLYSPKGQGQLWHVDTGKILEELYLELSPKHLLDGVLYIDLVLHNAHGVCTFSDISGMANGLEIRSPFLDHKVIEFALSIPIDMKIPIFNKQKYILRQALKGILPAPILARKKISYGEGIPFKKWFKNEWREMVKETILDGGVKKSGFFDMNYISNILDAHMDSKKDNFELLWALFCFSTWHENNF